MHATTTLPHHWLLLSNSTSCIIVSWIYPTDVVDWPLGPYFYCVVSSATTFYFRHNSRVQPDPSRVSRLGSWWVTFCLSGTLSFIVFSLPSTEHWLDCTNLTLNRQFNCPQRSSVDLWPVAFYRVLAYPKSINRISQYLRRYVSISRLLNWETPCTSHQRQMSIREFRYITYMHRSSEFRFWDIE